MLMLGEAGLRRQPDVAGGRILRLRSSAVPGPGELVDLPGQLEQLALDAGLELHDRLVALLCGLRGTEFVPRASFFQLQKQRSGRSIAPPGRSWPRSAGPWPRSGRASA